jgi:hypothetical protein
MNDFAKSRDYERTDADPRLIGALAAGVAFFLAATPFILEASFPGAQRMGGVPHGLPLPPTPRLQVHPKDDLLRLRRTERQQLTSYAWIDRDRRIVRIPIDRALQLVTERGLDGWPPVPAAPQPSIR